MPQRQQHGLCNGPRRWDLFRALSCFSKYLRIFYNPCHSCGARNNRAFTHGSSLYPARNQASTFLRRCVALHIEICRWPHRHNIFIAPADAGRQNTPEQSSVARRFWLILFRNSCRRITHHRHWKCERRDWTATHRTGGYRECRRRAICLPSVLPADHDHDCPTCNCALIFFRAFSFTLDSGSWYHSICSPSGLNPFNWDHV